MRGMTQLSANNKRKTGVRKVKSLKIITVRLRDFLLDTATLLSRNIHNLSIMKYSMFAMASVTNKKMLVTSSSRLMN